MTSALSEKRTLSDIRAGYSQRGLDLAAARGETPSDADVRNLVEGYRTEAEVVAEAETSFNIWWNGIDEGARYGMDGFAMWRAYKEGRLSMARELGRLPLSDSA